MNKMHIVNTEMKKSKIISTYIHDYIILRETIFMQQSKRANSMKTKVCI